MTSGGQLSWEEKRALVVYDKLQQEAYAEEKRRRVLEVGTNPPSHLSYTTPSHTRHPLLHDISHT